MIRQRLALAVIGAIALAGCNILDGLPHPEAVTQMEVWNRTEVAIFLVDDDGRRIDVPACDRAGPALMRMDPAVKVFTADGFVAGYGTGEGAPQYLVFVAGEGMADLTTIRPLKVPPCLGEPKVALPFE